MVRTDIKVGRALSIEHLRVNGVYWEILTGQVVQIREVSIKQGTAKAGYYENGEWHDITIVGTTCYALMGLKG